MPLRKILVLTSNILSYYLAVAILALSNGRLVEDMVKFIGTFLSSSNKVKLGGACTQPAIQCSKLTIETLEQGVKYVQS